MGFRRRESGSMRAAWRLWMLCCEENGLSGDPQCPLPLSGWRASQSGAVELAKILREKSLEGRAIAPAIDKSTIQCRSRRPQEATLPISPIQSALIDPLVVGLGISSLAATG